MKPTNNTTAQIASQTVSLFRKPLTWILLVSLTTFSSCFRSSYRSEGCPATNQAAARASYRGR